MAGVYWAARDLDGVPWGNHQFILIFMDEKQSLLRTPAQTVKGQKFATLGGHQVGGKLVLIANQTADVRSVEEVLDPSTVSMWADFDLEKHKVKSPTGGDWSFAFEVEKLAYIFDKNAKAKPIDYALANENCSAWVNTLLKVAGVPLTDRQKLGEFSGIDWGEEDLLPEEYFK
jgi:hypothetical protein